MKEEAYKKETTRTRRLGPRTHLLVLVIASILAMTVRDDMQVHLLVALSVVYLVWNHLSRKAFQLVVFYCVCMAFVFFMPNALALGTMKLIVYTMVRMMPVIMIGTVLIYTPPGSIMSAFEKMYVPKPILVMICILIRFFPVVILEMKAIRDGIRARGIFPHWYSVYKHPAMAYECFFMPLVVRCLKLSSELASSAELRGIECTNARTSIYPVGFKTMDGIVVGVYALIGSAIYWTGGMIS
ncbi:energy-coupling factor transporter transmembrane component T [Brevibacillus brevis]|uniref:energy-coupling factor transporter transmembrane component T n=1 Tax=Brevibacillus brevis TaxID=1393 RepID=UPI000D0E41A0|nr:energy-coupling factor transporter transmembrane component T [Brevibacillus brevis]PSJ68741.1 cobalt transporter [Brevibacillus brevis]RED33085.1 energy-coupling factor transport system permease protein [Brevibacillus brevis]GEC92375.1 ABC transporter permease [Brevibacillus brevis]VEF90755.1 ABC-type cobalt transport system, permease component CbiQ and related transporters [Brevibacillus brevis]